MWFQYDPKHPPKMGQKARSRDFSEFEIVKGFGHLLCEGDKRPEAENWEIWVEDTPLPPVGSTIKVAPHVPRKDWAGSIGKVVATRNGVEAIIEWESYPGDKPSTIWNFPNYNVEVVQLPDLIVKVGQIWKNDISGQQEKITEIKNGDCFSIMVDGSIKVDRKSSIFGSVDKDGRPVNWSGWSLFKEARIDIKVGQIWKNDRDGHQEKIVEIKDGNAYSTTVDPGSGSYNKEISCFGLVNDPSNWAGWSLFKEEPMQTPIKVGQTWERNDGLKVRITKIERKVIEAIGVGGSNDQIQYPSFGAVFVKEGYLSSEWKMKEDPGSTHKLKVGQIWKSRGGCVVKITSIKAGDIASGVVSQQGDFIEKGFYSSFTPLNSDGTAPHFIEGEWKLTQDAIPEPAKVGQVYRDDTGWEIRIDKIHAGGRKVGGTTLKGSLGSPLKDVYSEHLANLNTAGVLAKNWQLIEEPQETPKVKETIKQEEPMAQVKVGQVWYDERRKWEIKITSVDDRKVGAVQIGDSNGYKDGHQHPVFAYLPLGSGWKMVSDAPAPPTIKVGDRIQHTRWSDEGKKWIGVVKKINDDGSLQVRFDDHYKAYAGEYPKDWHTVGLHELTMVSEEKQSFGQMVKSDFKDAMWRSGATAMTNAVQAAILAMFKDQGADEKKLAVLREILASEFGGILIRGALGYSLTHIPKIGEDPRAIRLAKEFRVSAMSNGMDQVVGVATQYLLPAVSSVLSSLPQEKKRVHELEARVSEEEQEEEREELQEATA